MHTQNTKRSLRHSLKGRIKNALRSDLAARLTYPHGVDRYLEYVNPTWSLNEVRAKVVSIRSQTPDTVTISLQPNSNWQGFKPGQYVRLTVSIDGALRTRCFSPAQSAHAADGQIELTAKLPSEAFVTKYMRDEMQIGDVVTLSQAEGEFALPDQRPARILLISGGSGITPVMSMLRTLCDENYAGQITFLHYSNRPSDQLYAEELQTLAAEHDNVTLLRCYANDASAGELHGLFHIDQLASAVPDFAEAETFLCGPPAMMNAIEAAYSERGLSEKLHQERFSAAPVLIDSENAEGDVRFTRSERLAANNGQTLLDQAEAAGLKPASGCRMGICYACTCRKTSGQVMDTRTGQISDAGEQDIQICVSVPVGTVTLDI